MGFKKIIKNNEFLYNGYILLRDSFALLQDFFYLVDSEYLYFLFKKRALIEKLKGTTKLNVGCGDDLISGWLNIGLSRDAAYGKITIKNEALVLNFDMTRELPIPENSVKYVYASHFIEHLTFQDGIAILQRCYKVMKKDGVIRLTFPDMELWINNYYENDLKFFERYRSLSLPGEKAVAVTKGEIFMSQVHGWGHKWAYDFESMRHILEKAGFTQIGRKKVFESLIPEIKDIEPGPEGRLLETGYVEAVK
jgi:predicted SAM-dependent methyltransferase